MENAQMSGTRVQTTRDLVGRADTLTSYYYSAILNSVNHVSRLTFPFLPVRLSLLRIY